MKRVVIDLSSDGDDEPPQKVYKVADASPPAPAPAPRPLGMTASERKQLEEARAARAAAAVRNGAKSASVYRAPSKHPTPSVAAGPVAGQSKRATPDGVTLYHAPVVRRTFNRFYPGDRRALSIESLEQKGRIKNVVLASYSNDVEWLVNDIFPPSLDVTLVCHTGSSESGTFSLEGRPHFRYVRPPISSTMHIKFMLIFYDTFTRVVIPSANNEPYDWDTIENALWLQDFPLHSQGVPAPALSHTDFGSVWQRTLKSLHVSEDAWLAQMTATDFGDIDARCRLVLSWPGTYSIQSSRSGYRMLARQIRELGLQPPAAHTLTCEYNTSSVGTYTHEWLEAFYEACSGLEPLSAPHRFARMKDVPIHFVFPSWQTVKSSKLGPRGGGTLFFSLYAWKDAKKGWAYNEYAAEQVRDGKSQRAGILQHTKTLIGLFKPQPGVSPLQGKSTRGWAYVGSHNYTPSAWGRPKKGQEVQVANAELGIVFKLEADGDAEFENVVNEIATWERPLRPYERDSKGRKGDPWMQSQWQKTPGNPPFSCYHDLREDPESA